MNRPTKVRINGMEYAIEYVPELFDADNDELYGCFYEEDLVIKINTKNQTDRAIIRTLLHEICHAILFEHDVNCKGQGERMPKGEEEFCELVSKCMYQIMMDNKGMFEEFLKVG